MSAVKSIYHFKGGYRGKPVVTVQSAKIYLIHQAEKFLETLEEDRWIKINRIDPQIRKEVIEILMRGTILITGVRKRNRYKKYRYLRIVENDDWTAFMLTEGISRLTLEQWRGV